ncbi:four helix bundle protein [Anaerophilus nitritogenes]|uniref:four helix bundle protein n=1 Tax=Anaerophilus nitritogenes TaxID=2498136 RepID=UPI00101D9993|nr:four helix bundle protein [Anaerophilus nitritogenes]
MKKIKGKIQIKDFKQLEVWKKSIELNSEIYTLAMKFPGFENYALRSQIIRSSNSIGANIAEGNCQGQFYPAKELSYLYNSIGSAEETRHHITVAFENGYIHKNEYECIEEMLQEIKLMLRGMVVRIYNQEQNKEA